MNLSREGEHGDCPPPGGFQPSTGCRVCNMKSRITVPGGLTTPYSTQVAALEFGLHCVKRLAC